MTTLAEDFNSSYREQIQLADLWSTMTSKGLNRASWILYHYHRWYFEHHFGALFLTKMEALQGASLHVTWKQKRTSEILFSGFWVLLTDLTVKLGGKINLKEACLWKHCCMGTKPWECSLKVIQCSCHNQNHHRQIASYFIFFFLLLTSPDNNIKVSDTTRKKVYMHIFTRVQAGTPQHQLAITAGPKRMRE